MVRSIVSGATPPSVMALYSFVIILNLCPNLNAVCIWLKSDKDQIFAGHLEWMVMDKLA